MTALKNITNNNTSGEEDYYKEDKTSSINMLLALVFGVLAGFLFISLIKCLKKK